MDVSSFLGGRFLTHLDLPQPSQTWTVRAVTQEQIQTDTKVCLHFNEHAKPLGLNKTNLKIVAQAFGVQAQGWIGKAIELYRDQTFFQGKQMPCVRLRIPQQNAVQPQQPAAIRAYHQQPVAQPAGAWQPPTPPLPPNPLPAQPPVPPPQQPAAGQQAQAQPGVVASPGAPPWGAAP